MAKKVTDKELETILRNFFAEYGDELTSRQNNRTIVEMTEAERQEVINALRQTSPENISRKDMKKALDIELCRFREAKRQRQEEKPQEL